MHTVSRVKRNTKHHYAFATESCESPLATTCTSFSQSLNLSGQLLLSLCFRCTLNVGSSCCRNSCNAEIDLSVCDWFVSLLWIEAAQNLFMKYFPANYRLATSVLLFRNSGQVIEPVMCCMFCTDKDDLSRFFSIEVSRRNTQVGLRRGQSGRRQWNLCCRYQKKWAAFRGLRRQNVFKCFNLVFVLFFLKKKKRFKHIIDFSRTRSTTFGNMV